jgi:hypothetical protein
MQQYAPNESSSVAEFIRGHRAEILDAWKSRVRAMPQAEELPQPVLLDEVPNLLDRIARMSDGLARISPETPLPPPFGQGGSGALGGIDLTQVVTEFRLLRECILALWEGEQARRSRPVASTRPVNNAIDSAICESVKQLAAAKA